MAEENFVHKILDKLLDVIEVELKLPLGIAEVKMSPTAIAKEWRENQKKRTELANAIQRAEEKFVVNHKDQRVAQMLHELPLYSEDEFKQIIAGLLTHLSEEKISWLAEIKLIKTWGSIVNAEEIRKALELYLPYLRHELNSIKEFREVISALMLERIDKNTQENVEATRRIENKLDKVLDTHKPKSKEESDFWFIPHPYPMPPHFTGRALEQKMLDNWLADDKDRLFILRALGGFGKSALTWHWINTNTHVDPTQWTRLVWWSFYEGDASFDHFVEKTLKYLKREVPQGGRPQVDELLKAMQSQKILLIIDGFERALRAYSSMNAAYQAYESPLLRGDGKGEGDSNQLDCVNINAEIFLKSVCSLPDIKSKVLMTTRLSPRAVKPRGEFILGCREEELTAMQKADAVDFFHKQKIKGTHTEIESACAPYGYHPLSLRILAGLVTNDRDNPSDIKVAENLDITDDIIQNKDHVLKVSYDTLSFGQQKLLSNIACFRSSISYQVLKVITSKPSWKRKNKPHLNEKLDDSLQILESRGLLNWDRHINRYDLHPIVRRYAYDRLTTPDRAAAHTRLRDYFAIVNVPSKLQTLDDIAPVIELYHHSVQAGRLDEAIQIFRDRINVATFYQLGAYQLRIELLLALFLDGENKPPRLTVEAAQGWTLNGLANSYSQNGQPDHAEPLIKSYISISRKRNDKKNIAIGLSNLSDLYRNRGLLGEAERTRRLQIDLCKEIKDDFLEASGHQQLGYLLIYCGAWQEADQELDSAIAIKIWKENLQGYGVSFAYQALRLISMTRADLINQDQGLSLAINKAHRALEVANETAKNHFPLERDFVRAHWLLGAAYRINNQPNLAEQNLSEAITRCRAINQVESEARILLDLARLRYDQKNYEEAKNLADEALTITESCGYVLQGADVNLFLAQYALEQEKDKVKTKGYAETALKLATCDGPPYYYKVAYEEAERMLEKL